MAYLATTPENGMINVTGYSDNKRRGLNVYTMSEIVNVTGTNQHGKITTVEAQIPIFILTPMEREYIARVNSDIFGVCISRMNRISCLEWNITRKKNEEDLIAEKLKSYKQIYDEYSDISNIYELVVRRRALMSIREELIDVKQDLSNFDNSLRRWRKKLREKNQYSADEIKEWINNINSEDDFEEYKKKWVFDLMVHGASSQYKQSFNNRLEHVYLLPGGSVFPIRSRFVGSSTGYIQMLSGIEPKIYFANEMLFDAYVPISARSYGLIPMEALVNKIAESLLFDRLAAERADGTKPPEKLIVLGEQSKMFGDLNSISFNMPVNEQEQNRIETIVNEERKNAIRVITGVGTPVVADISKADTFQIQSDRQDKVLRNVAFVFSMSPLEISQTGSGDLSGRATAESQERLERERGIYPIVRIIDKTLTNKIIPFRYGPGWIFTHETGLTEEEKIKLETMKMQSGTYSVNEIREERGDDLYPDDIYDRPPGSGGATGQPGQSEMNPLFTKDISGNYIIDRSGNKNRS
jgi:hypothetical protein